MKLTIAIDTPPQGRPRFTRRGVAYDPPANRKFKAQFVKLVLSQLTIAPEYTGALKVGIKINRAAGLFRTKGALNRRFGDVDNLAKAIIDALTQTGAIWQDDSQIVDLRVTKATAPKSFVELEIEEC